MGCSTATPAASSSAVCTANSSVVTACGPPCGRSTHGSFASPSACGGIASIALAPPSAIGLARVTMRVPASAAATLARAGASAAAGGARSVAASASCTHASFSAVPPTRHAQTCAGVAMFEHCTTISPSAARSRSTDPRPRSHPGGATRRRPAAAVTVPVSHTKHARSPAAIVASASTPGRSQPPTWC